MSRPSPAQIETARRLLAFEDAAGGADPRSTAGLRVHDKLHAEMAPLVGDAGVQLLFVRSAKLAQGDFAGIAGSSILDGSAKLRERLEEREAPVGAESAVAMFGNFIALVTTFIGERLTQQVLRRAWPTIEHHPHTESES